MASPTDSSAAPPDPAQLLRSRSYIVVLVFGAVIGAPVAAIAYFFLKAVSSTSTWVFTTLPGDLGFSSEPLLWPLLPLTVSGLLVGLTLRYLPGTGGHKPAEGFHTSGATVPIDLPGIIIASFATLSLGVVLGPEAPLIAIGSGLGVLALHFLKKDAPDTAVMVIGAAGSFAAVSTLLGSPLVGAFMLMEAAGIGGPLMPVVLVPGLLAAGVGTLIFIGLDSWTGYGTQSLAIPDIPPFATPTVAEFLWAIGIGLAAAVLGAVIRRAAILLQPIVEQRMVLLTPIVGFGIGVCAVLFAQFSDHDSSEVLFSGQDALTGPDRGRRRLDRRRADPADALQGHRVHAGAEQLPRRSDVPGNVHRRRRRHRALAPPGPSDDRRRGDGHRRPVRRNARPAAHLGAPHRALSQRRRAGSHPPRDRFGHRVVRRIGAARSRTRGHARRGTSRRTWIISVGHFRPEMPLREADGLDHSESRAHPSRHAGPRPRRQ